LVLAKGSIQDPIGGRETGKHHTLNKRTRCHLTGKGGELNREGGGALKGVMGHELCSLCSPLNTRCEVVSREGDVKGLNVPTPGGRAGGGVLKAKTKKVNKKAVRKAVRMGKKGASREGGTGTRIPAENKPAHGNKSLG